MTPAERPIWMPSIEAIAEAVLDCGFPCDGLTSEVVAPVEVLLCDAVEKARRPAVERARLDGWLEALDWMRSHHRTPEEIVAKWDAVALALVFHDPQPPTAADLEPTR